MKHNPAHHFSKGRVFKCDDCDNKPDAPMLEDGVWLSFATKTCLLCIPCTVRRLGRPLRLSDLRNCPGNQAIFYFLDQA